MQLFQQFLQANKKFSGELRPRDVQNGYALIEANQIHVFYLYSILKIGVTFAHLHKLTSLIYPSPISPRKQWSIGRSFGCIVPTRLLFIKAALIYLPTILFRVAKTKTKADILNLEVDGIKLGEYIFDAVYRPQMKRLSLRQRAKLIYYLLCFYMDRAILETKNIKLVVIGDPAHRNGMLFALCRTRNIQCVNAINPDIFQMHKYFTREDFSAHFRDISDRLLQRVASTPGILPRLDTYLIARFNGAVRQHDVMRAYGSDKIIRTREQLVAEYGLDPALPIVFVMAHVFCDAPHTYAHMLYGDYEEWLLRATQALAQNPKINVLVKEHPTADLYQEAGVARALLASIRQEHRLLKPNVHTQTVLANADAILTCGGTIGIEASLNGIPVVLAARPPYSGKGYTIEPRTAGEYERFLSSDIANIRRLSPDQVLTAKYVAYTMFELFDNEGIRFELGGEPHVWGKPYNETAFFRGVVEQSAVHAKEQKLYAALKSFNESEDTSLINYAKLEGLLACTS